MCGNPYAGYGGANEKDQIAVWYAEVNSTSGTVAAPSGGTLVADRFASGVDALCSTISTGLTPDLEAATESDSTPVLVSSFDIGTGAFTLSGTPSAYPVAVVFAYKVKGLSYDQTKDLVGVDLDEAGSGGGGGGGEWEPVGSAVTLTATDTTINLTGLDGSAYKYKLHLDVPYPLPRIEGRIDGLTINDANWISYMRRVANGSLSSYNDYGYCSINGFYEGGYFSTVEVRFGSMDISANPWSSATVGHYINSQIKSLSNNTVYMVETLWEGVNSTNFTSFLLTAVNSGVFPIGMRYQLYRIAL